MPKEDLIWRKKHLKNLIWSANNKEGLFNKSDIPRFKSEIKNINKKLKKM